MTTAAFIVHLRKLGVRVWADAGEVRVVGPAEALTADVHAEVAARRADLLVFLQAARSSRHTLPELKPALANPLAQPLSFTQERFLFMHQLDPADTAYSLPSLVRLRGALHLAAFRRAWAAVIRRHDTLRTAFRFADGRAIGVLGDAIPELRVVDLRRKDATAAFDEARAMADVDAATPFDLERGEVLRGTIVQLSEVEHLLIANGHHIVSDQWSNVVMFRELAAFYAAYSSGRDEVTLPPLTVQYADFAAWQRRYWDEGGWQGQLSYWRQQLAGVKVLELPTDYPRPTMLGGRGATLVRPLDPDVAEPARRLAVETAASPGMIYLAAFFALLHRYGGGDDIVIGQPVAGRRLAAVETLVGPFINTLALRVNAGGRPTFRELLLRVKAMALGAYDNQDFPFERLIADLAPVRDTSHAPLVQVLFNFVNAPAPGVVLEGLTWEPLFVDRQSAQFDLGLSIDPVASQTMAIEYNTSLFSPARIARMMGEFTTLLKAALADPSARIGDLQEMSTSDRHAVVQGWNDTARPYPQDATVVSQFEARAAATPDQPAVICAGQVLSYRALNERSNQVARLLLSRDVRPGALVGVGLERSADMVVAVLGVLKAGAAYVPLDPAFPPQRLAHMLHDADVCAIITEDDLAAVWPTDVAVLTLDGEAARVDVEEAANLGTTIGRGSVAYVIYTSGSTGLSKGVEVSHGALANFLASMAEQPGIAATDALLAVTTLSFDIAGLELYGPLVVGGTVVLATRDEVADATALMALMATHQVTILQATPATYRLLIDADWPAAPQLRALCGGEPLPRELAAALLPRVGELWNMYGPTETTIWSTCARVFDAAQITIGRPIANTQAYVLDAVLQPLPIGVPGELYIGGDGVARGYLHRPALTAERFVPDPFARLAGSRLYRTGDIARFLDDGRLECLGRLDHQVKVRGFRIELGEVETALLALPEVKEAVAVVHDDRTGDKRLVAYVVFEARAELTASDVRRGLKVSLPDYMVPSFVVRLEHIPLTANGKVDRRALPDPLAAGSGLGREGRLAPRTTMEHTVADIWGAALGHRTIAISDNFFEVGGHSLLAMQVIARIQADVGVRLSPRVMIMDTLEQVAARCEREAPAAREQASEIV